MATTVDTLDIAASTDSLHASITAGDFDRADSWTIGCFWYWDSTSTTDRWVFSIADDTTTAMQINVFTKTQPLYRLDEKFGSPAVIQQTPTLSNQTWYGMVVAGNGTAWKARHYNGSTLELISGWTGTSIQADFTGYDHFAWGARWRGDTQAATAPLLGEICLMGAWSQHLSDTQCDDWIADPLNFATQPDLIRLYETDGTIAESGGTVTNNGSYGDFTLSNTASIVSANGVTVPSYATVSFTDGPNVYKRTDTTTVVTATAE